jgi:uncharacterized damage-inducible protein DinB
MIPYGAAELAASFRTVRGNTVRAAEDIPEEHYDFRPAPDTWPVADLLAHIAISPRLRMAMLGPDRDTLVGFDFFGTLTALRAEQARPRTKAELVELLTTEGERTAEWLASFDDDALVARITQPDGKSTKTRLEMLMATKEHEMHHRGQLMLIQRMLGIVPHGTRAMQARAAARA